MKDAETDKDNSRLPRVRGGGPRAFVSSNTDKPNCGIIFRVRGDVLEQGKESDMATSSITANFVMSDPKVSRAFVRALLARRPRGNVPRIRNDWEVLSDPDDIRGFFGRKTAKKAVRA